MRTYLYHAPVSRVVMISSEGKRSGRSDMIAGQTSQVSAHTCKEQAEALFDFVNPRVKTPERDASSDA